MALCVYFFYINIVIAKPKAVVAHELNAVDVYKRLRYVGSEIGLAWLPVTMATAAIT